MEKEEEDARLLARYEAKREERANHWQCYKSVQNVEDKPWNTEDLKKLEDWKKEEKSWNSRRRWSRVESGRKKKRKTLDCWIVAKRREKNGQSIGHVLRRYRVRKTSRGGMRS